MEIQLVITSASFLVTENDVLKSFCVNPVIAGSDAYF